MLRTGLVAAAIAGITDVAYVGIILMQGSRPLYSSRVLLVAVSLSAAAVAALAGSTLLHPALRVALFSAATTMLFVWGALGIWSIGVPLLVAGGFALWATLQAGREATPVPRMLAGVVAVAVLGAVSVGIFVTA